jgi:hypothetical protein
LPFEAWRKDCLHFPAINVRLRTKAPELPRHGRNNPRVNSDPVKKRGQGAKMKQHSTKRVAALWLLALLGSWGSQAQADTQTRSSSFEYDASGLLVREVVEPDRPNDCLQTSYSYDAYGNKTSVTIAACACACATGQGDRLGGFSLRGGWRNFVSRFALRVAHSLGERLGGSAARQARRIDIAHHGE